MQNRNMFLYRRQGPKKRAKPGPSRKNRGPQKGLPNSARDLLPLIQPATKALAQMLAGRTGVSGQLGHARAVLAQTERLVADRAHNRLNPAEREEFFEQVARLKLTLADADSEAEVQATEDETPTPSAMPVDRERLKEMAMALTSPGGPTSYEDRHKSDASHIDEAAAVEPEQDTAAVEEAADEAAPAVAKRPEDPNQLRLPRAGAEQVSLQPGTIRQRTNGRRRIAKPEGPSTIAGAAVKAKPSTTETKTAETKPTKTKTLKAKADEAEKKPDLEKATADTPSRAPEKKLPKGWIIDEEGFVVPGPAA